jgi:hypothetical protein
MTPEQEKEWREKMQAAEDVIKAEFAVPSTLDAAGREKALIEAAEKVREAYKKPEPQLVKIVR